MATRDLDTHKATARISMPAMNGAATLDAALWLGQSRALNLAAFND